MEEIFADAYADIKRGKYSIQNAKTILKSQTNAAQRAEQNKKATGQKTAPPEQKFSSGGYAKQKKYATIKVTAQEYAQIQSARMSKYTTYHKEMKTVDGVYAHYMFYVIKNNSLDSYETIKRLDPAKDTDYINFIVEEIENGTFDGEESYRELVEMLRRVKRKSDRNRNYDIRTENSRAANRLVSGVGQDADTGRNLSSGDRGNDGNVKQKFSVSEEMDAEYLEAVEQGDMKMAQRMVDEAAEKAGFTVRAYHGTPNGTFYEFKDWQYFTEDASYADVYQEQGASVNFKKTANKPKTYDVLHAINGRQKNSSRADTKSQGVNPSTTATISLSEFLSVVNTTHQSILSKNVLDVFEEQKNEKGYYAGRVKFSTEEDTAELDRQWRDTIAEDGLWSEDPEEGAKLLNEIAEGQKNARESLKIFRAELRSRLKPSEAAEQVGEPVQLMNNSKLYMPTAARFRKLTALLSVIS